MLLSSSTELGLGPLNLESKTVQFSQNMRIYHMPKQLQVPLSLSAHSTALFLSSILRQMPPAAPFIVLFSVIGIFISGCSESIRSYDLVISFFQPQKFLSM